MVYLLVVHFLSELVEIFRLDVVNVTAIIVVPAKRTCEAAVLW